VDVETNLPPKKEYILYAPLSMRQREAYDRVLSGGLRRWLIHGGTGGAEVSKEEDPVEVEEEQEDNTQGSKEEAGKWTSKRRKTGRKIYVIDGDDDEYFDMLEKGEIDQWGVKKQKVSKEEEEAEEARIGREHQHRTKGLSFYFYSLRVNFFNEFFTVISPEGEQHETSKRCDAAPESVFPPIPVRLACRSGYDDAHTW
jgi:ATP-dependent DNA helicase